LRPDLEARSTDAGRRRLLAAAALALLAAVAPRARAQDDAGVLARRVKGALLHRFLAYVEWPESALPRPDAPLVIGILGDDVLATELQAFMSGRTVEKRPVSVRRLRAGDAIKDVHVLYIASAEAGQLERVARAAPGALIVTDWPGALDQGSVINFVIVNDQVRFDVSLAAARQRNLRLSSRLLSVAHEVRSQP
jgi:hypothetical protein